jgi:hypothetical protein
MITQNLGWVFSRLNPHWVVSKWILLGCGSVMVRFHDAIEATSLRSQVHYLFARMVEA